MMKDFIRYNKHTRRFIITKLYKITPRIFKDKLLDFMYPDDCLITFKGANQ